MAPHPLGSVVRQLLVQRSRGRTVAQIAAEFGLSPATVRKYTNTASEDFVLERHGRVVRGAGTSGHGFKFGPLLGERLADLAITA